MVTRLKHRGLLGPVTQPERHIGSRLAHGAGHVRVPARRKIILVAQCRDYQDDIAFMVKDSGTESVDPWNRPAGGPHYPMPTQFGLNFLNFPSLIFYGTAIEPPGRNAFEFLRGTLP